MEDSFLKYTKIPPSAAMAVPATEEQKQKVEALRKRLQENVVRIQNSAEFRNFLIAMSRFHNYSWNNQMLIWIQKPGASHVAGYRTWEDLGRHVKLGEQGIAILAPQGPVAATTWIRATDNAVYAIKRTEYGWGIFDNHEHMLEGFLGGDLPSYAEAARKLKEMGFVEHKEVLSVHNFKVVYVFDILQTQGKPLPEFQVPELTGEPNPVLFEELLHVCKYGQKIKVSFEPDPHQSPTCKGYYRRPDLIWIRPDTPEAQQLDALIHETCHHFTETVMLIPRADAETIAESAAFVVGAHYGFNTGAWSFPYVAKWAGDEKRLSANLNSIQEVAEKVIDAIEANKIRLPMTKANVPDRQTIREWEDRYSRDDLIKMAKGKGLDIGGSKRELIERILRGQFRMRI